MGKETSLIVVCNDEQSLKRNLLASDMVKNQLVSIHIERNAVSASLAYNRALEKCEAEIFIFAHQDVYFPPGWEKRLENAIEDVEAIDPDWALLGSIGMSHQAKHVGQVWSTSLGATVGQVVNKPEPVQSVDELVIILRRTSGVRFDDALPEFHLYGTDIVQNALAMGKGAYVCQLPVVHNDRFHDQLRSDFARAYTYIRAKWREILPLRTTVLWVTKNGLGLTLYRLNAKRSLEKRRALSGDVSTDPRVYSAQCSWE